MKKVLTAASLLCIMNATTHGLINLGEGRIDFGIDISAVHDSSIRSNSLDEDDIVISTRPSLRYFRPSKNFDLSASVGLQNTTYVDFSEFDKTNAFFDLNISPKLDRETSRFEFSGSLLLNSETRAEEEVGDIITTTNYGGSAQLVYRPNRRYSVTGTVRHRQEDPDGDVYSKRENTEFSGMLGMVVAKGIMAQARVGYTDTSTSANELDSKMLTYSAGLSGELLPKVSGSFQAGIQERDFSNFPSDSNPYLSASMEWQADERSSVTLSASNSLGTTFSNRSSDTFSLRLTANRSLSRELNGSIFIGYRDSEYGDLQTGSVRSDDGYDLGAQLQYQLVRYGSIGLTFDYSDRSSNRGLFDYSRTRIGVFFRGQW